MAVTAMGANEGVRRVVGGGGGMQCLMAGGCMLVALAAWHRRRVAAVFDGRMVHTRNNSGIGSVARRLCLSMHMRAASSDLEKGRTLLCMGTWRGRCADDQHACW